jgi:NAD(P)-dependent dehydrogenase (short-subunit alcohol dehydrogenase family)
MADVQQTPQAQRNHGTQSEMGPQPLEIREDYIGSKKLEGKVAIITGGDSGIGRSVALHFAKEGADIAVAYLDERDDAADTQRKVEKIGRQCILVEGDIGKESFCQSLVAKVIQRFGKIDILVNNAGEQHPKDSVTEISADQLERTFRTNMFAMFFMVKACMPHLGAGSVIINTTSVTSYKGSPELLDYSATKGAITSFTRSLSTSLAEKNIRVNGVAPGPIWTPLIVSTFDDEEIAKFGKNTPMKRAGQPSEVAPCYVFLASEDASYMTGQVLHPNGGTIVNA